MKVEIDSLYAADKTPLCKSFLLSEDGELSAESYPHVLRFNSLRRKVAGIEGLAEYIKAVGSMGGCLLKGQLDRELRAESRAGHTDSRGSTRWICLDVDGLAGVDTVQDFVRLLPEAFRTTSYVIQYSSSMGIVDKGLSAHVFFLLRDAVPAMVLKRWLIYQNLTMPLIAAQLKLTRSQVAMRFPLDVTTCQNDKLIYVAPARRGEGVEDTFEEERVQVVKKRYVSLDYRFEVPDTIDVEQMMLEKMNSIREDQGMPKQDMSTKRIGSTEVLKDVTGEIRITSRKEERGFAYLNLNGGDSWGYYHPTDNCSVLYNFKGEPNLDIESTFPEYYATRAGQGSASAHDTRVRDDSGGHAESTEPAAGEDDRESDQGEPDQDRQPAPATERDDGPGWITLVGIENHTGDYFGLRYEPSSGYFNYTSINARTQIKDYCHQHGVPSPERLHRWSVGYDFSDFSYKINEDNNYINLFDPPDYIRSANRTFEGGVPGTIGSILKHVVGDSDEAYELLLNWLACVVQYRRAIGTAWLLSGTQGTGKGLFFTHIMMPILGRDYVSRATLPTFEKEFNGFMERSLLIFVDEIRLKELKQASVALSNLKQYITDDVIALRRMRTDTYLIDNHANFVFASNHYDSMEIDPSDRRFLVAPRQEAPLSSTIEVDGIINRIRKELGDFTSYLLSRTADLQMARSMYHSSERERLKHLTRNASDEVADAIRAGDFEFFVDEAPDVDKPGEAAIQAKLPQPISYGKFLKAVLEAEHGELNIPRDMLRMVWWHITGAWFQTPTKFSKFVGKMGLEIKKVRIGDDMTRGLHRVQFNITDRARQGAIRWLAKQNEHVKSTASGTSSTSTSVSGE